MDKVAHQTKTELESHGFVITEISFESMTTRGGLQDLQHPAVPDGDALSILRSFPHFIAVHRTQAPKRGIFFVVLSENLAQVASIYSKYFPDVVFVKSNGQLGLLARWKDSNLIAPLKEIIRRRMAGDPE